MNEMKKCYYTFVVPVAVFVVDQLLKYIARSSTSFILNTSWLGFFSASRALNYALVGLLFIVIVYWRKTHYSLPLGLMIAGGLSNVIDRFFHEGVIDYLFMQSLAINIADIAIWTGCLIVAIQHLYSQPARSDELR